MRTSLPDVALSSLLDPIASKKLTAFRAEVENTLRPAQFKDLHGLVHGLSTGLPQALAVSISRLKVERVLVDSADEQPVQVADQSKDGANLVLKVADPIAALFGRDPLAAREAVEILKNQSPAAIEQVLPFPGGQRFPGPACAQRLVQLAQSWGDEIVPHLEKCLREGSWAARTASAPLFGGLQGSSSAERVLIEILEGGHNFDAERMAVEAVGWLGADGWANDLDHKVCKGRWERYDHDRAADINEYAYGKLWSYGVRALALFASQAPNTGRARHLLHLLDRALLRQLQEKPNVAPNGIQHVEDFAHRFSERQVDALLDLVRTGTNEQTRCLYLQLIGTIVPVRAARHLLAIANSPEETLRVRESASIALGEIRVAAASELLADVIRKAEGDLSALAWAASTLFAAGGQWSDNPTFYNSIAQGQGEPAVQLQYALAVRGDHRCIDDVIAALDHTKPYYRWSAALSLARLLGPGARDYLRDRVEDAAEDLERVGMLAALVRSGDHDRADDLHAALQCLNDLRQLRLVWRMEIVDALRCVPGGRPRFEAWSAEAFLNERHRRYFDGWAAR